MANNRGSRMYSVINGVVRDYVPLRTHKRGHYEKRDGAKDEWVLDGIVTVAMLSDVFTYQVTHKGIKIDEYREKFVSPLKYAVCAWDDDAPHMSRNEDRLYSGKVVDGNIDGDVLPVVVKGDQGSTDVWVLVREGWPPFKWGNRETFAKYRPSILQDRKKSKHPNWKPAMPGAFKLGSDASAQVVGEVDEDIAGPGMKSLSEFGVRPVFFAFFCLKVGESLIGQTKSGEMWKVTNRDGELNVENRNDAEKMRPVYNMKDKQRIEAERKKKIDGAEQQRAQKKAALAQKRQDESTTRTNKMEIRVDDDQVVAKPAAEESEEVSAEAVIEEIAEEKVTA